MTGRRLWVAVAIGLVGLSSPGAAAAAGNTSAWHYVVTSVTGSATWRYAGAQVSGVDTARFTGRLRAAARLATTGASLQGRTSYTDQNSSGCGPVTHTRRRSYQAPHFSVQGSDVVVSWNFPLPSQSYCSNPMGANVARMLQSMMSQSLPLTRFTCERMLLNLSGQAQLAQAGVLGKLTYHAAVIIKRI